MNKEDLKKRTKAFAIKAIHLIQSFPPGRAADILGKQFIRAATSVGANYRAACRARSKAEFISKLGVVEEEADECLYWIELIQDAGLSRKEVMGPLFNECNELLSIIIASIRTARSAK